MKTTTIVPVFNEEKTVASILKVLNNSDLIDKIIVVDDASTDNSLKKIKSVKSKKTRVISLKKNLGKSGAVKAVAKDLKTDIIFFCDADLHNFNKEHIQQILKPLKNNKNVMSAGIRDYGSTMNFLSQNLLPLITGERALPYSVFQSAMHNPLMEGYGMEVVLNDYCKRNSIPIHKNIMEGLRQTAKTKKWKNGGYLLAKETLQVILILFKLKIMASNH